MPSDPEKAYAKKYKINDLLNELYSELTQSKPENPIEHAIKHLEAKLPKKEKAPSLSDFKITSISPEPDNNILNKFFKAKNSLFGNAPNLSGVQNISDQNPNTSNIINPLINFNIMVSIF